MILLRLRYGILGSTLETMASRGALWVRHEVTRTLCKTQKRRISSRSRSEHFACLMGIVGGSEFWQGWMVFATLQREKHDQLTGKEPFFFLSPRWRGQRCPGPVVRGRQPDIAPRSKRVQVLKSSHEGGRRGVHGNIGISPTPSQRVHRVAERGRRHAAWWCCCRSGGGRDVDAGAETSLFCSRTRSGGGEDGQQPRRGLSRSRSRRRSMDEL